MKSNQNSHYSKLIGFLDKTKDIMLILIQDTKIIKDYDMKHVKKQITESIKMAKEDIYNKKDKLKEVGLLSKSLDFELKGFNELYDEWKKNLQKWSWDKFKKITKYLLKWINCILGSMAIAIPGLDIVKQIKERIELIIDADDIVSDNDGTSLDFLKL